MAVIFIVENGSIVTGANSYCTVEYYIQYWENRGSDFSGHSPTSIETLLIRATEKIDQSYFWKGYITLSGQSLMWPRCGMYDSKNNSIDCNTIPNELKNAVCSMAAYICLYGDPDENNETGIKSKKIGPISVTFTNGGKSEIKAVDKALSSYINSGVQSVRV